MKKQLYILLVFILISFHLSYAQSPGSKKSEQGQVLKELEPKIDKIREEFHAAGLAVAVVYNGEMLYSKGFGYRDFEKKLPVDEHTAFGIGSCTKAFTAAILGQLETEGKLKLTDKPVKYIPSIKFYNRGMNDSIQIHHLLTHTTGINNWPSESTAILFTTPDKQDLLPRMTHLKPLAGVGKKWIYNNLMYALAGMIAEQASNKSIEELWKQNIFTPLAMDNTFVDWKPAYDSDNFAYGYVVDSQVPHRAMPEDMTTRDAAGAIYSSASDMAKWMKLWLNEGAIENKQLLSEQYIETATSKIAKMPNSHNDSINSTARYYGYGWSNGNYKNFKVTEHSGGVSGYSSNVALYPEKKLGIVVLTNQTTSSLAAMTTNIILGELFPNLREDDSIDKRFGEVFEIAPVETPSISQKNKPSYSLKTMEGVYEHPGFGEINITVIDKTVYAQFPFTRFRLTYAGDNTFTDHFTTEVPHVYWNFMRLKFIDKNGDVNKIEINLDQEPVTFTKQ